MKPRAWLLLEATAVPEQWRSRAIAMAMVPLLPDETEDLIATRPVTPLIDDQEEAIVKLLAHGASAATISRQLRLPLRSVHRQITRLCDRFGVRSTPELVALLARRGL